MISKEAEAEDILCAMQSLIIDTLDSYSEEELRNMRGFPTIADLFHSIGFALAGDFTNDPVSGRWQDATIDGATYSGGWMAARWGNISQVPGMTRDLAAAIVTAPQTDAQMINVENRTGELPPGLVPRLKQLGAELKATGVHSYMQRYIREL